MINLKNKQIILSIVLVVILIITYLIFHQYCICGTWESSDSFLEDSGLNNMILMIGQGQSSMSLISHTYPCYLFAENSSGIIEDTQLNLTTSKWFFNNVSTNNVKIDTDNILGEEFLMRLDPKRQLMTFLSMDKKTILAEFYKNNKLTDAIKIKNK
jgi:hypothetical protein